MAWIELHQELPRHVKPLRLCETLRIREAEAVGHLAMLWLWALEYAEDGDLSRFSDKEIARAAGWRRREPERFVQALAAAGFVTDTLRLHDWQDYAGRLIDQRQKNRIRKQRSRQKAKEESLYKMRNE